MLDPQGVSKGSGFVAFSTPEEASKAVGFNCSMPACFCFRSSAFINCSLFLLSTVECNEWKDDWKEASVCCCRSTQKRKKS